MYKLVHYLVVLLTLLCVFASQRLDTSAQVKPVNDYGSIGLTQQLRRMNTTASVMMIGAHPDDEDSALMAYLARGENARTAYLSLTRGDGGQNIIGQELFESLGIIRTEELLQARRYDGAEQYFARAFDYGFSKTLAEAKSKWDEKVLLCDAVKAIRLFRPLVVISRFSGTPADGHGQHQFAGYISPLAVKAAGDGNQCNGDGDPWLVRKFYVEQGFSSADKAALQLNTGRFDTLYGRSYFEIAIEGRSQHRSQGEGRIELKGDQFSGLRLQGQASAKPEISPFDGLDITINGIAKLSNNSEEPFAAKLKVLSDAIAAVRAKYRPDEANDIISDLAAIYKMAYDAEWSTRQPESKLFLEELQAKTAAAIRRAAGVQIDLLADKETATPGDEITANLRVFSPMPNVSFQRKRIEVPSGYFTFEIIPPANETQAGPFRREQGRLNEIYRIKIPNDAGITEPYWLRSERKGEMFDWPDTDEQTLPFSPQGIVAHIIARVGDVEIPFKQPLEFRFADPSRGEIRRNINVVPELSVSVDQKLLVVPQSSKPQTRLLTVGITNNSTRAISGVVGLNINAPEEWKVTAVNRTFDLKKKGEQTSMAFEIAIPAKTKSGTYNIFANAMVGEGLSTQTMNTIAYPHIQTHRFYSRAEAKVEVLDLKVAPVKVGYIMGSGDEVADSVKKMGVDLTMLEEKDLTSGDLSKFETILVGIRATETRPDFVANIQRLLDYVKNGGHLIVQYQRSGLQQILPFPVTGNARVVDENAKVTILQPADPVFNFPNKITDADFNGWVQERNAYNFGTFDEKYVPLLETHDAGEAENKGGLVVAVIGSGKFVYCSYSFFRQLPSGVHGAYRLFANLISMPKINKSKDRD